MAIVTTTLAAVINKITDVLHALVPGKLPERAFERSHPGLPLAIWALTSPGEEIFRKFEIVAVGPREDPGTQDPSAILVSRTLRLRLAYPATLVGLYGRDDLDDLEDLVEDDARRVRDVVYSPGNLIDGCNAMIPRIEELGRTEPAVWFQDLSVRVLYYTAQSLT